MASLVAASKHAPVAWQQRVPGRVAVVVVVTVVVVTTPVGSMLATLVAKASILASTLVVSFVVRQSPATSSLVNAAENLSRHFCMQATIDGSFSGRPFFCAFP